MFKKELIHFVKVKKAHLSILHAWLEKPHIKPYFHGQGLQNTYDDLKRFTENAPSIHMHWLAYYENLPFAYVMNSEVFKKDEPYGKWIKEEKGTTVDLLIGDPDFLGKGLSVPLIQQFLKDHLSTYPEVFIDPASVNERAIYVYQKAGFEKIDTFIASWDPTLHILMKLNWDKIEL